MRTPMILKISSIIKINIIILPPIIQILTKIQNFNLNTKILIILISKITIKKVKNNNKIIIIIYNKIKKKRISIIMQNYKLIKIIINRTVIAHNKSYKIKLIKTFQSIVNNKSNRIPLPMNKLFKNKILIKIKIKLILVTTSTKINYLKCRLSSYNSYMNNKT